MLLRVVEADGFIRSNRAFRAKIGFSDSELSSEDLLHWIEPDDRAAVRAVLEGERSSCRARHRTRSGEELTLELRLATTDNETIVLARCAEVALTSVETTEESEEATVRRTLTTIAKIVEAQNPSYKCSILLVADGRLVSGAGPSLPDDYNDAIDGYAVGPTVGSCGTAIYWNIPVIAEDLQADPLWAAFAELAKAAGVASCWSHPFTAKNGRVLGALALYSPEPRAPTAEQLSRLKAAAQMTGLAVERGRAEEALRKQRERELKLEAQLRQAVKMEALGSLAGGIAHDFNNLLTAIIGFAGFIRDEMPEQDRHQEDVQEIMGAASKAASLTRQLLLFARRQPVEMRTLDVGSSLVAIAGLLRRTIGEDIVLSVKVPDDSVHALVDSTQFDQIVLNLSVNARDAMPSGGILDITVSTLEITKEDKLGGPKPGQYVRLEFADNGVGMDAATQARIFEPFFTTKTGAGGTGLGLATCYGAAQQAGGTIQVDSTPGEGTTFCVYLPVYDGPEIGESLAQAHAPNSDGNETILIIEDEDSVRRVAERALRDRGYCVLVATDAPAGLQLYRQHQKEIALVFSDVVLPNGNGFDLADDLKRMNPAAKVLLTSGYTDHRVEPRNTQFKLLWKPYTPGDLAQRVRECLDAGGTNRRQVA